MGILSAELLGIGYDKRPPYTIKIETDNTKTEVQVAGYLGVGANLPFQLSNQQMAEVLTSDEGPQWFKVQKESNGTFSLVQQVNEGVVDLPVVDGNFTIFDGTEGDLKDGGFSPSDAAKTKVVMASAAVTANHIACFSDTAGTVNDDPAVAITLGDLQAGVSGDAGSVISFPAGAAAGKGVFKAVNAAGDYTWTISNVTDLGQTTQYNVSDAGSATQSILTANIASAGFSSVLKCFDITAGFADLASGGAAGVVSGAGYKIRGIWLNSGGTNFSGGGGDRDIQISDGTAVYSLIPAATAQALVNMSWGIDVDLPFPAAVAINRTTTGTLFIAYSGGTTDYSAGSVVISFLLQKVA